MSSRPDHPHQGRQAVKASWKWEACALSGPLLDVHSQPNTYSHLLWPGTAFASVCRSQLSCFPWGWATSARGTEGGTPSADCTEQPESGLLGEFRRSHAGRGGQALAGRGDDRAAPRVSCRAGALGRLPGDSWLLGNSWPHWGLVVSLEAHLRL